MSAVRASALPALVIPPRRSDSPLECSDGVSPHQLAKAGADVPPAIRSRADDCTARLHRRREALAAAGKSACKANAAVARELACWVWEIGCRSEGTVL